MLLTLSALVPVGRAEEPALVAVISGQGADPYLQTVDAFVERLEQQRPEAEVARYVLDKDAAKTRQIFLELQQRQPSLLFTLGSTTTRIALAEFPDRPLIASMIVSAGALGESTQATGVLLRTSPATQLKWLRRVLPDAKRVAVLYDPKQSQEWVDELTTVARGTDLQVIALPVTSPKELPPALKKLGRQADVLLGIPDNTVYSGKTAEGVLLSSFRNRVPFVGLSSVWVKAGALYALDWDYRDLGGQCAGLALRILDGTPPSKISHGTPETILYSVNLKTAKHMGLEIDPVLIDGAASVFR
jgi:putative ABC transport system substrate-binding protein